MPFNACTSPQMRSRVFTGSTPATQPARVSPSPPAVQTRGSTAISRGAAAGSSGPSGIVIDPQLSESCKHNFCCTQLPPTPPPPPHPPPSVKPFPLQGYGDRVVAFLRTPNIYDVLRNTSPEPVSSGLR